MKTKFALVALLALASAEPSGATPPLTQADLLQSVATAIDNKSLQAVSLAVVQGEHAVSAHAGSLSSTVVASPDDRTLYEIGSVTKVFTGLLLADAVVRGEVSLDTPVSKLLPEGVTLPDAAGDRITLRMLATHTSGLPRIPVEIPADDYRDPYATYGEAELWATLRRVKLDFPPGSKASYSNLAAGLLGTLLARNAGMTYAELLSARITRPLGMNDTVIALRDGLRERFAPPFNASGKSWTPWNFKALAAAGGIRSTTADMIRFATAMLHPERTPLQRAIELSWAKQDVRASISAGGQALGWMVAGDGRTRWHNGMTGGFHAALFVNRELGIATLLLANRSTPIGTELAEGLMRRAAGSPDRAVPNLTRATIALTPDQLDRCTGTYRFSPQFALVIERRNETLFVTPTNQATDRLYAATPDTFFSRRVAADIVFELPAGGGSATALTLKQSGHQMRAVRE